MPNYVNVVDYFTIDYLLSQKGWLFKEHFLKHFYVLCANSDIPVLALFYIIITVSLQDQLTKKLANGFSFFHQISNLWHQKNVIGQWLLIF